MDKAEVQIVEKIVKRGDLLIGNQFHSIPIVRDAVLAPQK